MKKTSQKTKIKQRLLEVGYVDNFFCIEHKITVRLGAVIFELKKEGMEFDEAKSGYLAGTKNWRYYRKGGARPKQKVEIIEVNGERIARVV